MSRTLPTSGRPGSPAAVRGTRVAEPGARPRRLSGSTSAPSASSRSRNSRHSRAFNLPFGRRHRNSSHTVRASSIRLKPGQSRTTSRISVISRALKVRPVHLVVAVAIAGGSPWGSPFPTTPYQNAVGMFRGGAGGADRDTSARGSPVGPAAKRGGGKAGRKLSPLKVHRQRRVRWRKSLWTSGIAPRCHCTLSIR